MSKNNIASIKSIMLSEATIQLGANIDKQELYRCTGNIGTNQWIFIRLSENSRVRMSLSETAKLVLIKSDTNDYFIQNSQTHEIIIKHVIVEPSLVHAPEQLFFYYIRIAQVVVYSVH